MLQVSELHRQFDELQRKYGAKDLQSIYGAGEIHSPKVMFIFMNPTGRNIASNIAWQGLRAPWLGTKQIWSIFVALGLLDRSIFEQLSELKINDWSINFAEALYRDLQGNHIYLTNLAKCTQIDARPLPNNVFKAYLDLTYSEIGIIKPQKIVTFGNQVSSIILKRQIRVSTYFDNIPEILRIPQEYYVYPTFYPVGQGRRNMPLAIERLRKVLVS